MKKIQIILSLILMGCFLFPQSGAEAAATSTYDLIVAVNSYRYEKGLDELPTNVYLMAAAQNQATYLANTYGSTPPGESEGHLGEGGSDATDRAEQVGYLVITGVQVRENWAGVDASTSLDTLLHSTWGDSDNTSVMLHDYATQIGAGMAQVDNIIYYVLNISVDYSISPTSSTLTVKTTQTPGVVPVAVSTPLADGSIIHVVAKGQALWSIAITYGVTVDQIQILNNLSENAAIYEGDNLLIRAAYTSTPTLIPTNTPMPPTRTPIPPQTPQALNTQASDSLLDKVTASGEKEVLGIALIAVCGVCLVYLIYTMLRKKG
ncbi:MAG: LysM peptidoglycan-binding domain-containing protein [Anaerolineaceae bacterium]